jgi:hypothetical protein
MLDPNLHADARLTRFFSRSGFVQLAKSTKVSYTNDYRVFFDFLWLRRKYWDAADPDDLVDFEDWRRRSPRNPARISGTKWNRELAALQRLYGWAAAQRLLTVNPVAFKTVRNRHGDMVETADAWAKDVRSSNVRWLTSRAYRLWRDVGLRGYTAEAAQIARGGGVTTTATRFTPTCCSRADCAAPRLVAADVGTGAVRGVATAILSGAGGGRGDQEQTGTCVLRIRPSAARDRSIRRHDAPPSLQYCWCCPGS